ncbi:hypothetical protein SAMN05421682_113127 [Chryseobacterium indoltheticum]|uniref:Uncharacterized protein n=1 Tax=Chryseobacterium indoltheticum TaxID=254 RepID=A0A381F5G1_9FLAO|nr:hypothetical protein SAMN05421682_113127 [Chryseobacterium indoltheticum]SUX41765.1 Uncharacterised protein [Chryseobacterium indoltheticum]SUX48368.1 Uncharacterised protein [Chryseobacterium indoltheticum]
MIYWLCKFNTTKIVLMMVFTKKNIKFVDVMLTDTK